MVLPESRTIVLCRSSTRQPSRSCPGVFSTSLWSCLEHVFNGVASSVLSIVLSSGRYQGLQVLRSAPMRDQHGQRSRWTPTRSPHLQSQSPPNRSTALRLFLTSPTVFINENLNPTASSFMHSNSLNIDRLLTDSSERPNYTRSSLKMHTKLKRILVQQSFCFS